MLLIVPTGSYRAVDFFEAAEGLGVEVAVAAEQPLPLVSPELFRQIDCDRPEEAAAAITELATRTPIDAIVPIDDTGVVIAALASEALGLPHNPPLAAQATRDKGLMRRLLAAAEVNQPGFILIDTSAPDPGALSFPVVVKPLDLQGSKGVIKVDSPTDLQPAAERSAAISKRDRLLVEEFVPGPEVAVEGLLWEGRLEVLAIFDKPDPLDGPYFEETLYVTPSRLPADVQAEATRVTGQAVAAIGLRQGPIHAELRVAAPTDVKVIEVAGRSIGGICGRSLSFGLLETPLEGLILRQALGRSGSAARRGQASGVMMIPIPRSGVLESVSGIDEAKRVPGITSIDITTPIGGVLKMVPEAESYLGFIFAKGSTPTDVETALRDAHLRLSFSIRG